MATLVLVMLIGAVIGIVAIATAQPSLNGRF